MNVSVEGRVAIGLGTIALGLGLYAAVLEPHQVSSETVAFRKGRMFDDVSPREATRIDVDVGGVSMSVARTTSGWEGKNAIDPARVDAIVNMIDRTVPVRAVDRGKLGLVRARYTFSFASRTHVLSVGGEADVPVGGAYVSVGERTMVVSRDTALLLLQSPLDLLDTNLWAVEPTDIRTLSVGRGAVTKKFEYHGGALFSPEGTRITRKEVDDIFGHLLRLRVERFLPPETTQATSLSVTLQTKTGPRAIEIGGSCGSGSPDRVARVGDRYACVAGALASAAESIFEERPDLALFSVHRDEVERVTLRGHGSVFEAARKESGFHLIAPVDKMLLPDESEALERWLDRVLGMSATSAPARAEVPKREIELTVKGVDGFEERVLFGNLRAYRMLDGYELPISADAAGLFLSHELPSEPHWLVPRDAELRRVVIKCSRVEYEWAKKEGRWLLAMPSGLSGFLSRWNDTLAKVLAAKRGDLVPTPKGGPTCLLRFDGTTVSFFRLEGGRVVALQGGLAFELSATLLDSVERDFVDPVCMLGDQTSEVQNARVSGREMKLASVDLLAVLETVRVERVGPPPNFAKALAEWGDDVTVGENRSDGRILARCGNQPVTFSVDAMALRRALGLTANAQTDR